MKVVLPGEVPSVWRSPISFTTTRSTLQRSEMHITASSKISWVSLKATDKKNLGSFERRGERGEPPFVGGHHLSRGMMAEFCDAS